MGDAISYDQLMGLSYSLCNMVKLLNKAAGLHLLEYIAEEVDAHAQLIRNVETKGDDAFDEIAYKSKYMAGLDNDLKISITEKIGDILVDNDILR